MKRIALFYLLAVVHLSTDIVMAQGNFRLCEGVDCNCAYIKDYQQELSIECIDTSTSNNCTRWFHELNNTFVEIENFRTETGITLPGKYTLESYGNFTSINSTGDVCYYLVLPTAGFCSNCTTIEVNGIVRNNNDIINTTVGNSITIGTYIPPIYDEVISMVLRLNDTDISATNMCTLQDFTYTCSNLTTTAAGVYRIHVLFKISSAQQTNQEWCSPNVTINVLCGLPEVTGVTVDDQCLSDVSITWTDENYDPACGNISYRVTLKQSSTRLVDMNVTENQVNLTGLSNNTAYNFTVQTISAEGIGNALVQSVRTVDGITALPNKPTQVTVAKTLKNSANVSWSAAESPYCRSDLYYVCSLLSAPYNYTNVTTTSQNCTFNGLTEGTTYNITVAAVNRAGMGEAATTNFTLRRGNSSGGPSAAGVLIAVLLLGQLLLYR